jgi:hypothetical protein
MTCGFADPGYRILQLPEKQTQGTSTNKNAHKDPYFHL